MTPMQKQFKKIKEKYPDGLILFRLGDFYECFDDDAVAASKILNITLTKRGKDAKARPMAGIPHHALKNYLGKLVEAGRKVVIVDQVSQPEPGKIVEREVTDIITPGAVIESDLLKNNQSNYLAITQVIKQKGKDAEIMGNIILFDLGTGEIIFHELELEESLEGLLNIVNNHNVVELYLSEETFEKFPEKIKNQFLPNVQIIDTIQQVDFNQQQSVEFLKQKFQLNSFKAWGFNENDRILGTFAALVKYVTENLNKEVFLENLRIEEHSNQLKLPHNTVRSLELFYDANGRPDFSLFQFINRTQTAPGSRLLQQWLLNPLLDKNRIILRQDVVKKFIDLELDDNIVEYLDDQPDYPRLVTQYRYERIQPRHLLSLGQGLIKAKSLQEYLTKKIDLENSKLTKNVLERFKEIDLSMLEELGQVLVSAISETAKGTSEIGFINPEYDDVLKEIVSEHENSQQFLTDMAERETEATGISSLKIKQNKVFGYFIEVSKVNSDKVPKHYVRKQTLVNAERYITDELKTFEDKINSNWERRLAREQKIWDEVLVKVSPRIEEVLELGKILAEIDCLFAFANVATSEKWTCPEISQDGVEIRQLAHPVLQSKLQEKYVSNDIEFSQKSKFHLITGPNMAGKSTYIRSVALAQILAQIGSFVPASKARLQIVDGIFCRVGAADNLAQNESTFMVEMLEMATILKQGSKDSLLILDEVGRGTSTYDGLSLAWALVEEISQQLGAKTLFATHYHELTLLDKELPGVKNYFVEAILKQGELYFTHIVKEGVAKKSLGVEVAKLAGINSSVIKRAREILKILETENDLSQLQPQQLNYQQLGFGMNSSIQDEEPNSLVNNTEIIEFIEQLIELSPNEMTPLAALQKITELRKDAQEISAKIQSDE